MKRKILLFGKNGQIGRELTHLLRSLGSVTPLDREDLDLCVPDDIRRLIRSAAPDLIVNAAAYTAVDSAETDESTAFALNAQAPGVMAEEAKSIGAVLVHYSTDYVFDGTKDSPYVEEDRANPQNAYGRTKLAGERAIIESRASHLIFRTEWVYAREGKNFLLTILRLATEREELRIVQDQIGSPTWSRAVAEATTQALARVFSPANDTGFLSERSGIYHMTAAGQTNWYEFARLILDEALHHTPRAPWFASATRGRQLITRRVIPLTSAEYPTPARRPSNSVLSNARLMRVFGIQLADWQTQLHSLFDDEGSDAAASE
jgi:dTDP-4-dehydrorhamnose reductase